MSASHPGLSSSPPPLTPAQPNAAFLNYPPAAPRISSSPASSPRVVDSNPVRMRSVRPELRVSSRSDHINFMDRGVSPGVDFFYDSSDGEEGDSVGDEEDWVDEEDNGKEDVTRDFSEVERQSRPRRQEQSERLNVLQPFNQIPAHDSGTWLEDPSDDEARRHGSEQARQISVKRLGQVRIVHNKGSSSVGSGTPRDSLLSQSNSEAPMGPLLSPTGNSLGSRPRRNTSDSLQAVLQTHAITMKTLGLYSPNPGSDPPARHTRERSLSQPVFGASRPLHPGATLGAGTFFKSSSLSSNRRIQLSPLASPNRSEDTYDPDRPSNLPAYFIKTPYPFTSRKEFPKPRTRPRRGHTQNTPRAYLHAQDGSERQSSTATNTNIDSKGRQVLGLEAIPHYSHHNDRHGRPHKSFRRTLNHPETETESILWLSLIRHKPFQPHHHSHSSPPITHITIPTTLETPSPARAQDSRTKDPSSKTAAHATNPPIKDFDDAFLALALRKAHKELAGPWIRRVFSARSLRGIGLGEVSVWSGASVSPPPSSSCSSPLSFSRTHAKGLLAARAGLSTSTENASPFTERQLWDLYRDPSRGKARYTWVHWGKRVACASALSSLGSTGKGEERVRRTGEKHDSRTPQTLRPFHPRRTVPETIITLQFIHTLSATRICLALAIILLTSIAAALLWIFLGKSGWVGLSGEGRGERVGSGMLVALVGLVVQGAGVGVWVWMS
ncbi:hypothetical protein B0J11DRAFT_496365 [Dendryphion nanum]|uniref:Uncharacterized protein n=1 Tax=Dendryphion nanum TaxID=256645 RepID=A0A9P9ID20_9PLEO|nr:hypothetical protein B0J11DRAFT_496365 [Dendryphion nanum]